MNINYLKNDKTILDDIIINNGFYDNYNVWNSIKVFPMDQHIYRDRVETIIIRNNKEVFVKKKPNGEYFLPGGSKERNIPDIDQAVNECREECRINVINIESTGISYKIHLNPPHQNKMKDFTIYWNGLNTDIYIAKYESVYKGKIANSDKDPFMLSGKFYSVKDCLKFFRPEHRQALIWYLKNHDDSNQIIVHSKFENTMDKFLRTKIKTPQDLFNWMNSHISSSVFTELKSDNDVYKSKCGSSHDQVMFENTAFNYLHKKHGGLLITEKFNNECVKSHSLLFFIQNHKYYWFENSMDELNGINGPYSSLENLKSDIKANWVYENNLSELSIININNISPGMTQNEYINACEYTDKGQLIQESASGSRIYIIMNKNMENKNVNPKTPNNYFTQNGFENSKTKRVSFYTSISGAIMSLVKREEGMRLYVHTPMGSYNQYYKPTIEDVPDCKITGEVWIDRPIKLKCIGLIELKKETGKIHKFKYGQKIGEVKEWEFNWVEKYDTDKNQIDDEFKYSSSYMKNKMKKEYKNYLKESKLTTDERNELPIEKFGIPELKKYPLNDKSHVISAIRYFNQVNIDYEEELAKNIIKSMKKYGIPKSSVGVKNRLQKYL